MYDMTYFVDCNRVDTRWH